MERATFDSHYLEVLVRPRRGVTRETAEAHLQSIGERMQREHPRELKGSTLRLEPYMDAFVGGYRMRLTIVLGAVALVLLIGCGNVAHLMLARATARGREVAIRTALGAGRVQIVRQFAAEGVVLAALAAVGGLLFAAWAIRALVALSPPGVPRIEQTRLDFTVMSFALAIAVFSTVLAALAPTIRTIRRDMTSALKAGGRGVSGGRDRLRSTLIAGEVALTLVLLAGAGLLIRSAIETARVPLGFDPNGLLSARVSLPAGASRNDEQIRLAFQQMVDETSRIAGVESAALVSQAPLGPGGNSNGVVPEGRPPEVGSAIISKLRLVTSDYFRTARVTVLRGRQFDDRDRRGTLRVVIVSESLARQAFPNQDAVGKRIACCEAGQDGLPAWWTIVGVAQDVHSSGPGEAAGPEFYIAAAQAPTGSWDWVQRTVYLMARTSRNTSALAAPIRAAVASVTPDAPVFDVQPMRSRLASSIATERFNTFLLTLLSAVGLIFAAVGVYGVVAYSVGRRTQEVGVRMALGATRADVMTMVLRQAAQPVLIGVVFGLAASLAATRLLSEQLVGVTSTDPATFGSVIALLVAVALGASLVPARRASRLEPTVALRYE
jgi:predicted permease